MFLKRTARSVNAPFYGSFCLMAGFNFMLLFSLDVDVKKSFVQSRECSRVGNSDEILFYHRF
jgi:hypothetical protein